MGNAFSGPDAFKFFNFTPKATAVLQADPFLLVILLLVLSGLSGLGVLSWYIHWVTNKPYKKPKVEAKPGAKRGGIRGMLRI